MTAPLCPWRPTLDDPFVELDCSHSGLQDSDLAALSDPLQAALRAMAELEAGAIANPDEGRQVGHYWLRAPALAPDDATSEAIRATLDAVASFAARVHAGDVGPAGGGQFHKLLLVGIGGSALGPMLLADAFADRTRMQAYVLDNTDPDGIDRMLREIGPLGDVLIAVVSKSGGTPETRNGMVEVMNACSKQGVEFAQQAMAVTGEGSALHQRAQSEGWLATFPMWDWVGGRTSLFSAVGLLPAALMGLDVRGLLAGAAAMDQQTRSTDLLHNPAALLTLFWHKEGEGRGARDAVVLPYRDSLLLFSRYLQQLVMESLGKQFDRQGNEVDQGLSVYGNKGSTDQHAYVQQLRDGLHNFFVLFVRVLQGRAGESPEVEPGVTAGDYLTGFWLGTRAALAERGRRSVTLTLEQVDERSFGALIALFERAVGLYAELVDINAYHQPGVEAGKKAAADALALQARVLDAMAGDGKTAAAIAAELDADPELVWQLCRHLAAQRDSVRRSGGRERETARFQHRV